VWEWAGNTHELDVGGNEKGRSDACGLMWERMRRNSGGESSDKSGSVSEWELEAKCLCVHCNLFTSGCERSGRLVRERRKSLNTG
jgi:hypothetical protein